MASVPPPVQYATTPDGFNIAFGVSGSGMPLIFLPLTFSHVQLSWTGDTNLQAWLEGLSSRFLLIQYDGRGQGMSTRRLPAHHSSDGERLDLEAVIDHLGLERFALLARGPLGHTAIRYAAANPGRVEALVLFSLPAAGQAWPVAFAQTLAGEDWDLFLQSFYAFDGRPADSASVVPRLKQTVTQEDWSVLIKNWIGSDVTAVLPYVAAPTLVLHAREVLQPHLEESQKIAAGIPNARLTVIDGTTQLGVPEQGLRALDEFLAGIASSSGQTMAASRTLTRESQTLLPLREPEVPQTETSGGRVYPQVPLSSRENEVLRLLAEGKTNPQIAEALFISHNTVAKHVTSILTKTGATNRVEAATYAQRRGLGGS